MQLVVSDTGPINYLVLIGHIDILPALFQRVLIPLAVREELKHATTPVEVRRWIAHPPAWLDVRKPPVRSFDDGLLASLDVGEREAIQLAMTLQSDTVLLIDDRKAVRAAIRKGLEKTGTIGLLNRAAQRGLLDLADAFARLRRTTFRFPEDLAKQLLDEQEDKRTL